MKTREKIRRSRDEEKMKLNCLINCPSPKINYYNSAPRIVIFQKKLIKATIQPAEQGIVVSFLLWKVTRLLCSRPSTT